MRKKKKQNVSGRNKKQQQVSDQAPPQNKVCSNAIRIHPKEKEETPPHHTHKFSDTLALPGRYRVVCPILLIAAIHERPNNTDSPKNTTAFNRTQTVCILSPDFYSSSSSTLALLFFWTERCWELGAKHEFAAAACA